MAVKLQPEYSGNPWNNKYKEIMAKQFYVYILANTRNGTIYTGMTSNLSFRFNILKNKAAAHKHNRWGKKFNLC
jgi:predicted GIY-YIG superfamily endonuclease